MPFNIDDQVQYAMQAYLDRELQHARQDLQQNRFHYDKRLKIQGRITALSEALDMLLRLQANCRILAEERALMTQTLLSKTPNLIDL